MVSIMFGVLGLIAGGAGMWWYQNKGKSVIKADLQQAQTKVDSGIANAEKKL